MANASGQGFAVVRIDLYPSVTLDELRANPGNLVTVKEVVPTREEAEREVERLSALTDDSSVYFAQYVQVFPEGRDVQVGY